jgi:Predicted nuclease of the RecB family
MDLTSFMDNSRPSDYEYLIDPAPQDALKLVNLRKNTHVLIIYGDMVANYEGRAKSELGELMPRLIISKPDGTFMIHEATKREPRLWNPPPSSLYATIDGGVLVLRSVRAAVMPEWVISLVGCFSFVWLGRVGKSGSLE